MKPVSTPPRRVRRALVGTALFGAGYAVASVLSFATSINLGLVQALDSVGKNLFGSQVFSARTFRELSERPGPRGALHGALSAGRAGRGLSRGNAPPGAP